jgi:alanyl-tRNA synthetase
MCKVLQGKESVYDTDLFLEALQIIKENTSDRWADGHETDEENYKRSSRIIADHSRTAFMLVNDGLIPSNI